jgi:hypothetical protein
VIAFVAGATGYVGQAVVRQLAAAGHRAVAHVRPDAARRAEWEARFPGVGRGARRHAVGRGGHGGRRWRATAPTPSSPSSARRGRAGRAAAARGAAETYETVDYGLTALLRRAAERAAAETGHAPRFVYLSAAGVGPSARGALPAGALAPGARARRRRPALDGGAAELHHGPDRAEARPAERLGAAAVDALLAPLRRLAPLRATADRWRSTTADELAAALVRLATDPAAAGRVAGGDALR